MRIGFDTVYLLLLWIFVGNCLSVADLDKETLLAIEANFIRKLKLDSRPRPKRRIPIPEYIEQLYEQRTHRNMLSNKEDFFDSARSFFPQGE